MSNIEFYNLFYNAAKESLTTRQFEMFSLRYNLIEGAEACHTLQNIGDKYGISRERVRQIINTCIHKIRIKSIKELSSASFQLFNCLNELNINSVDDFEKIADTYFDFINISQLATLVDGLLQPQISVGSLLSDFKNRHKKTDRLKRGKSYTDIKLNKLLEKINWPSVLNKNIDSSLLNPKRRVQTRERAGIFFSFKMDSKIEFESTLEYKFYIFCEKSTIVQKYYPQPLIIKYENDRSYYPDVLLILDDGRLVIVELKDKLHMITDTTRKKYSALKIFCEKNGVGYLMTDCRESFDDLALKQVNQPITAAIKNHKHDWLSYKEIKESMNIDFADLAAVVLNNNLNFSLAPFSIN